MNKIIEVFKPVPNFPAYRVSNLGRVQSRWDRNPHCQRFLKNGAWRDLKTGRSQNGYYQCVLCDGIRLHVTKRVHNLVTELFIGKKPKGYCVRHLDGNPGNNRLENLAYGTYIENENDKVRHGTWDARNGGAKLRPNQVQDIRRLAASGKRQVELAKEFKVSRPTITRIVNGTIWRTA